MGGTGSLHGLYFHVVPEVRYVIPSDGKSFHWGGILIRASEISERFVTPWYLGSIALGLVLSFVKALIGAEIRAVTLVLAVFVPSQFAVSLLGEGVRDLSKHLAGAQFCLDLLNVFLVLQLALYGYQMTRASRSFSAPR